MNRITSVVFAGIAALVFISIIQSSAHISRPRGWRRTAQPATNTVRAGLGAKCPHLFQRGRAEHPTWAPPAVAPTPEQIRASELDASRVLSHLERPDAPLEATRRDLPPAPQGGADDRFQP